MAVTGKPQCIPEWTAITSYSFTRGSSISATSPTISRNERSVGDSSAGRQITAMSEVGTGCFSGR